MLHQLNGVTFESPSLFRNPIITCFSSPMEWAEEKGFGMKSFKSPRHEGGNKPSNTII